MQSTNFGFLEDHEPLFYQLAKAAEQAFVPDPNTTLLKLRQLGEAIAQDVATRLGIHVDDRANQLDLLRLIQHEVELGREVLDTFHAIRKIGNSANHEFVSNHREALVVLRHAWQLGCWHYRTFGDAEPDWKSGAFKTPQDPSQEVRKLEERIKQLEKAAQASQRELKTTQQLADAEQARTEELERYLQATEEDKQVWQSLAEENEAKLVEAKEKFALEKATRLQRLDEYQGQLAVAEAPAIGYQTTSKRESPAIEEAKQAIRQSYWSESEAETRLRIDQQLRDAGWEADTVNMSYGNGIRPEPGRNLAIAEWPTDTGPADYVLFCGLVPIAAVEAKKTSTSVAAAIDQAERYSKGFSLVDDQESPGGPWAIDANDASLGSYKLPFVFSTNGRPFLDQHKELSGIWFRDVRRPQNTRKANDGWYSPEGLQELLKQDLDAAEAALESHTFNFDLQLREYQVRAIKAAESAISNGRQEILIAMATGTGKTKCSIALIYRLLQAQRFRRILFLVDRSALGQQAADAFESTQMLNQQTFADTFNIKGLSDVSPESDTQVHVATVQGMVKRVLFSDEPPTVDQYDCIVVDECHRGYLLDREMDDTEITFRSEKDYISKYRRVIEHFDAVKIGLTATPALHTTEIFGDPTFLYSYSEAVIDGFLIDHDPPIHIKTAHNQQGIDYEGGEEIAQYNAESGQIDYVHLPDDVNFDISKINRIVEDESFNQTVCEVLADQIDPFSEEKTLIFCVTDRHADMVVRLMKDAIEAAYGSCEDGLVKKITGNSDKPLEQIRRYKNERLPGIAVTVDLLTTGIDVPEICNLVFLRPVKSRILYEQMKGRATRLCPDINKEVFRIFDAVNLFDNLEPLTNMKPVVVNPNITFKQLEAEVKGETTTSEDQQTHARDQFIGKLQRKKRRMSETDAEAFETHTGMSPDAFIAEIKVLPIQEVAGWFVDHPGLGELLDSRSLGTPPLFFISEKEDELQEVETLYGRSVKPDDYLEEFEAFIRENENKIIALKTLIHQPGKITRQQIKELLLALSAEQFTESNLRKAWAMKTHQDVAARIVGYIRKAAMGDALVPWEQRVDNAVNVILAQQEWKPAQRNILSQIGSLLKTRLALDEQSINESALKQRYGPFDRINKIFDGELPNILESINDAVWQANAS